MKQWLLTCALLVFSFPSFAGEIQSLSSDLQDSTNVEAVESIDAQTFGGDFWSRSTLTGDWSGVRDKWAAKGFTVSLNGTYIFQGVASGGLNGPFFETFSDEDDTGHTISGDLSVVIDTEKIGLWQGGFLSVQLEGRAGRSVLERAGSVSAVNNDALFPNVVDRFDDEALAITNLSHMQYIGEKIALYGGLLNTAEGDENEFAGSAVSNSHFMNSAMLYSLVEDATVPNVSLGGGVIFEPNEHIYGSFSIFTTEETAGENPFDHTQGTTFSTEWIFNHMIGARSGAQTFGFLYGIDADRTDIAADPRLVLGSILLGQAIPETTDDTWAFYYNAHQYMWGDSDRGWGLFIRFGLSDGNPNPVKWNSAAGLAGKGLFPGREEDNWGLGAFYLSLSEEDLLKGLGVENEIGGELFYNLALTPWFHVTLDVQVIDPALPRSDTAWVLGIRTNINL